MTKKRPHKKRLALILIAIVLFFPISVTIFSFRNNIFNFNFLNHWFDFSKVTNPLPTPIILDQTFQQSMSYQDGYETQVYLTVSPPGRYRVSANKSSGTVKFLQAPIPSRSGIRITVSGPKPYQQFEVRLFTNEPIQKGDIDFSMVEAGSN